MKRFKLFLTPISIMLISLAQITPVYAVNIFNNVCSNSSAAKTGVCVDTTQQSKSKSNVFAGVIKDIIEVLSFITGVAAVIMLIISGIRLVVSGGEPNNVASARTGIIMALIGIVIVVFAQLIVLFVLDRVS